MKNERYYYTIMSFEEQKAYKIIYNGLKIQAFDIVISLCLSPEQIQKVYLDVLYDNPLFYYVNQTVIKMTRSQGYYILLPEYIYTNTEVNTINIDIKNIVNKIRTKANAFQNNEFRLEKCLHDSIVKSVAYDYDSLNKKDCFNAHSIVGVFIDRCAVCDGISKAFKLLCNEFGIKCIVVLGKANKYGVYGEKDYHAWNMVKIGEESYYVDVTWDNLYDQEFHHISYDYFNVTTKDIMIDHQPTGDLPFCNATRLNYFYNTKSFVNTYHDLTELIKQRYSENEIVFKTQKQKQEFLHFDEIKQKTFIALMHVMFTKKEVKPFTLLFNEMHGIGKIIFTPKSKIDLKKHN